MNTSNMLFKESPLGAPQSKSSIWSLIEQVCVGWIVVSYSGFFVAVLLGNAGSESGIPTDPGPMARASWFPAYLMVLILLAIRIKQIARNILQLSPILVLLLLTIASAKWSLDPSLTQRRAIALSFTVLAGVYLCVRGPFTETLKIIGLAWFVAILFNFFVIFAMPSQGVHQIIHPGAWRGYMFEKNNLGGEMARINLIYLALLFYKVPHRKFWWAGLFLTALLVLGSTSKTALISMTMPYAGLAFYILATHSPVLGLTTIWAGLSIAALGASIITFMPDVVVALIGRDLTFTGRTGIWEMVIQAMERVEMTGYGFGAFWAVENGPAAIISDTLAWEVPTAHNSWLEIALAIGYPGMFLAIIITVLALFKSVWLSAGQHGPMAGLLLLQVCLFSLSESLLWKQNSHATMIFVFVVVHIGITQLIRHKEAIPVLQAPHWALPPRTTKKRN